MDKSINYEYRYNRLINAMGDIYYEYDIDSDRISWDGKFKEILGYESMPETLEEWLTLIHVSFREEVCKIVNNSIKTGVFKKIEFKFKDKEDKYIWLRSLGFVDLDDENNPYKIIGVLHDIDIKKKISEKLILSEGRLKDAQHFARLGCWEYYFKDKIFFWSDELYEIYGYKVDEVEPSLENSLKMVHPEDREFVEQSILNAEKIGISYEIEFRIIRKDGETRYVKAMGVAKKDKDGSIVKVNGSIIDISDLKVSQIEHRRTEQLYYKILSSIEEGVAVLDQDYNIIMVNSWLKNILKYEENYIGKNIFKVCPSFDDDRSRVLLKEAMDGKKIDFSEKHMVTRDGKEIYVITTFVPFKLNGTVRGVLAILKDVTIYRKAKVLNELSRELNNLIESQDNMFKKMKK